MVVLIQSLDLVFRLPSDLRNSVLLYCSPVCRCIFAVFFPSFRVASFFFLFLCGNCLFFLFFSLSFFPLRSAFSASSTFAPLSIIQLSFSLRSLSLFSSPSFCFHLHCIRYSLSQWWRRLCKFFISFFIRRCKLFCCSHFFLFRPLSIDTTPNTFIVSSCMEDTFVLW